MVLPARRPDDIRKRAANFATRSEFRRRDPAEKKKAEFRLLPSSALPSCELPCGPLSYEPPCGPLSGERPCGPLSGGPPCGRPCVGLSCELPCELPRDERPCGLLSAGPSYEPPCGLLDEPTPLRPLFSRPFFCERLSFELPSLVRVILSLVGNRPGVVAYLIQYYEVQCKFWLTTARASTRA